MLHILVQSTAYSSKYMKNIIHRPIEKKLSNCETASTQMNFEVYLFSTKTHTFSCFNCNCLVVMQSKQEIFRSENG